MGPLVILYAQWFVGKETSYIPAPFHCWFLYWLLLLNLAYVHIRGSITGDDNDEQKQGPINLPGPGPRFAYGIGLCGFAMGLVLVLLQSGSFGSMPMAPGSLVNDLLFFVAGTMARKHGWLEKKLTDQVGMPILLLRMMVVAEAILMCFLVGKMIEGDIIHFVPAILIMLVAGVYCVDMSLVLLEFFQTHLDFQNRFTKFLSDAAYTVYIVHPVFVVGVTSAWIAIYESRGNTIEWAGFCSVTPIEGGGLTLGMGWLASNVIAILLVWPFSWYLRKLPGLREIL